MFQPPQAYLAKLENKEVFNSKFTRLDFELESPHEMQFQAGQYVSIQINDQGERRSYSISSSPGIAHGFEILLDVAPMGLGVTFLQNLKFGDQIKILGPLGRFGWDETDPTITLIATGSGLGPLRSLVLDLLQEKKLSRPIILYWGLRHAEDLIYQDEFQQLSTAFPNFKFHPVLSQSPNEWSLCRGRVTDCLSIHDLMPNSGYYLCGNQTMIADVITVLTQRGVAAEKIHHEKFY